MKKPQVNLEAAILARARNEIIKECSDVAQCRALYIELGGELTVKRLIKFVEAAVKAGLLGKEWSSRKLDVLLDSIRREHSHKMLHPAEEDKMLRSRLEDK